MSKVHVARNITPGRFLSEIMVMRSGATSRRVPAVAALAQGLVIAFLFQSSEIEMVAADYNGRRGFPFPDGRALSARTPD
jgi:hypothetical protein